MNQRKGAHLLVRPICLAYILLVNSQRLVDLLHSGLECVENSQAELGKYDASRTYDLFLPGLVCQAVASKGAPRLLETFEVLLDPLDILKAEFGLDDLHVTDRVDVAFHMDDLGVVERADHLEYTINGTDVRQESVA